MKHQAFYKDLEYAGISTTVLYFKIDGVIFSVSFGYSFNDPHRRFKQMGNMMMKRLIKGSRIISMCDNLSNYVFDSGNGRLVNISENEKLIEAVLRMREELKKDIYKVRSLKDWKPKLNQELYFKMYK